MKYKPGTRVLIEVDCRFDSPGMSVAGMQGVYEGDFEYPEDELSAPNPRIKLDNGDIIWGIECWWRPVDEGDTAPTREV